MIKVDSIVRVRSGLRRGHLARVVATNFDNEKIPLALVRYRVCFSDGESDWYEAAMLDEWVVRSNTAASSPEITHGQVFGG